MAVGFNNLIWACYRSRYNISEVLLDAFTTPNRYNGIVLDNSKAFRKYMKIPLDGDKLEIPCVYKYIVAKNLYNNIQIEKGIIDNAEKIDTLLIPIAATSQDSQVARSSSTGLRRFLYDNCPYYNLVIKQIGDFKYVGGEGIIFYEDMTPMIMFTLSIEKVEAEGIRVYTPVTPILRINPVVYSKNDILSKYIRGKFLTSLFEQNYTSGWGTSDQLRDVFNIFTTCAIDYKFTVIVNDFSEFFVTPTIPDATFNSDDVNKLLNDNITEVTDSIV